MFSSLFCIDCLSNTTFCISNDFNIYSFGYCSYLSHGHEEKQINIPTQINNLSNINMISCGDYHTVCIDYSGNVFSLGSNEDGQLGIGKDDEELEFSNIPQKINIPSCKQVSCGDEFTICLTEGNRLYSFGRNDKLQLGLGSNDNYSSPQLIPDLYNISHIVCGGKHAICQSYENNFYSWGFNNYGQLGVGHNFTSSKPIQCLNWPDNIIDIKCGYRHSLLLTSEGQIYSFGNNESAQLGINDKSITFISTPYLIKDIPQMQRIECGNNHSLCIDINDNLWIFGDNYYGQLGLGDKQDKYKPLLHPTLTNIIDISSGGNHTFVKTTDNKIFAFGLNNKSQLGIKTPENAQVTPIQVFVDNKDIWCSFIGKNKAKSARK